MLKNGGSSDVTDPQFSGQSATIAAKRPRRRARAALVGAGLTAVLVVLLWAGWGDFCLGRAESALARGDLSKAIAWQSRGAWFGRMNAGRGALLQVRVTRRQGAFDRLGAALHAATVAGVSPLEVERERMLALAESGQFQELRGRWMDLFRDPRDDAPVIARAYFSWCMASHDLDEARRTLELWHADYPASAEPLKLLGDYHRSLLQWDGAEQAYRKAHTLAPDDNECRLALADVLTTRLKPAEAIPLYRATLAVRPDSLAATRGLARCSASTGNVAEGLLLLKGALERNPDDFETLREYGEMLLTDGRAADAVPPLRKAYDQVPEHANLANSLARALKARGRGEEARPLFDFVAESRPRFDELLKLETQLAKAPNDLEIRMRIAAITAQYVSRRDAIRWYRNLLSIAPGHAAAQQALAELERMAIPSRPPAESPPNNVTPPTSPRRN
jgi:tetratricopeptide (TPR) repeat protein